MSFVQMLRRQRMDVQGVSVDELHEDRVPRLVYRAGDGKAVLVEYLAVGQYRGRDVMRRAAGGVPS